MREQLIILMNQEHLSAKKIAEIVGVQPSAISHLISGRNKPGYEFIASLIRSFPQYSPDWLLLGIGDMYRMNNSNFAAQTATEVVTNQSSGTTAVNSKQQKDGYNTLLSGDGNQDDITTDKSKCLPANERCESMEQEVVNQKQDSSAIRINRNNDDTMQIAPESVIILFPDGKYKIYKS